MAARRLLIVMLVLLGLSTLAAALVPRRNLGDGTTSGTTTQSTTTPTVPVPDTVPPVAEITVGGKKFPVVPVEVGDQFTLLVRSRFPSEIAIPEFGLIRFATRSTPARFELLTGTPGTFGILFGASPKPGVTGKPAARLVVQPLAKKKKRKKRAKSGARAGSGPT
jgi:hypothetical protein